MKDTEIAWYNGKVGADTGRESMDWIKVTERTECVNVVNSLVTVYHLSEKRVVLIDAGGGECPAFIEDIKKKGLEVAAILCTHLHFDHISVAGYIWDMFRMPSYAHCTEEKEAKFPVREFPVTKLYEFDHILIEGERFGIIPTPGHTAGHLCFVTPDGVCAIGDVLMSEKPLSYAKLPYFIDVEESIRSMERLRDFDCRAFVACHEDVIAPEDMGRTIDLNIRKELEIYDALRGLVTKPVLAEELITKYMDLVDVRSSFIRNDNGYRDTVLSRIKTLEFAGELRIDGQWILPR